MTTTKKIPTSPEVYAVIWAQHCGPELTIFGTFSSPEGAQTGTAEMYTEWGFKGADAPLMAHRATWTAGFPDQRTSEYWLFSVSDGEEA